MSASHTSTFNVEFCTVHHIENEKSGACNTKQFNPKFNDWVTN